MHRAFGLGEGGRDQGEHGIASGEGRHCLRSKIASCSRVDLLEKNRLSTGTFDGSHNFRGTRGGLFG
jgi:hypothetical protein